MWSVLGTLISGFLLLRDFFGYMLPGAVLFASAALSIDVQTFARDRFACIAWPPKIEATSDWLLLVAIVGACYVLGHLLAAVGYLILDFVRGAAWMSRAAVHRRLCAEWRERKARRQAAQASLLFDRYRDPSLFIDHDRRDTIALFRVGLAMALIFSSPLLPPGAVSFGSLAVGLVMLLVSYRALSHVSEFGAAAIAAGVEASAQNMPAEPRGNPAPRD